MDIQPSNILPIDVVLAAATAVNINDQFVINNITLKKSETIAVIIEHGIKCVCCGKTALYFQYFDHTLPQANCKLLRLMFDHKHRTGTFATMTKDHIVPKKHGGKDVMENYQPMCSVCNLLKGDTLVDIPDLTLLNQKPIQTPKTISTTNIKPNIDLVGVIVCKGYIRWYTQVFHKGATNDQWNTTVRDIIIKQTVKTFPEYSRHTISQAYQQLIKELNKSNTDKLKPATYFKQMNKQ